jgi:chromosomal replication initiation ATPase DnaA
VSSEYTNDFQYVTKRSFELGVDPLDVRGPRRFPRLVRCRRQIATELRAAPWSMSLSEIGHALGGRDHTTILSLLRGGKRKGLVSASDSPTVAAPAAKESA